MATSARQPPETEAWLHALPETQLAVTEVQAEAFCSYELSLVVVYYSRTEEPKVQTEFNVS